MTTFTTQDRQDAEQDWDAYEYMCPNCLTPWKCNGPHIQQQDQREAKMKYDQEVYEALAENERTKLAEEVLRIGEILGLKTTSSDYNAFKVMEVIKQLIDASRLASKPMKKRPLTEDKIRDIWYRHPEFKDGLGVEPIEFARAIERAHGIGE